MCTVEMGWSCSGASVTEILVRSADKEFLESDLLGSPHANAKGSPVAGAALAKLGVFFLGLDVDDRLRDAR